MIDVLIDTNIVLDVALKRDLFFAASADIFNMIDRNSVNAYVTATTITDIYYIYKKQNGDKRAREFISDLSDIMEVVSIDREVILDALKRKMKDFEDAVQVSAALFNGLNIIITRNKTDYIDCGLDVYTPDEFIEIDRHKGSP